LLFAADTALVIALPLPHFDLALALWIQEVDWGPAALLMTATNWLADVRQAVFVGIVIAVMAVFNRRSALVLLVGAGANVVTFLLKLVIQRPRPPLNVLHVTQPESSFGFPSGHATFYGWFVPVLLVAVTPWLPLRLRPPVYLLGGLIVLFGATARVWAGAHWPTDVLGGVLLGGAWAAMAIKLVGVPRPK
jgi:membrane-associated phospholipid phosphatase